MKELRLMIPGSVEVSSEVLEEMSRPLVAHYGGKWTVFYNETLGLLRQVFSTRGEIVLFPGSGSADLDATFGSTLFPDGKVLIPQNGFFGERLEEIARTYTPTVRTVRFPLGGPVELALIEEELEQGAFNLVAAVHCETSIGMLDPIKEVGKLCKRYDTLFTVDTVSSLAIEPLAMDEWGIAICVSASQKGLESPPGLTEAAIGERGWKSVEQVRSPGWCLNLKVWREYGEKTTAEQIDITYAGFNRDYDYPPQRLMMEELETGEVLPRDRWDQMLDRYYALYGWDHQTGRPTARTPQELKPSDFERAIQENRSHSSERKLAQPNPSVYWARVVIKPIKGFEGVEYA